MATTILDVCQVAPLANIATPFSLPLTFYDLLWLKHPPVENIFFYQATNNLEPLFSHLKHSLSQTLRHFPILAGHVTWPHASLVPLVTYQNGDSVALTLARSDANFRHLSSTEFRKAEDYHPILPILAPELGSGTPVLGSVTPVLGPESILAPELRSWTPVLAPEPRPGTPVLGPESIRAPELGSLRSVLAQNQGQGHPFWGKDPGSRTPILAVQVTVFEKKGFSVGIAVNHAVMDGNSKTAFLKAWASISRFGENHEPEPSFERSNRFSKLDSLYADVWLKNNAAVRDNLYMPKVASSPGKLRGTFELDGLKLNKLKEYVISKGIRRVSSFALAYAYAQPCLVKARKTEKQRVIAIILADYRAHLDPPLPGTYFGNCVRPGGTLLELSDLLGDESFIKAIRAINEGIDTCLSGGFEGAEDWLVNMFDGSRRVHAVVSVAGSNRFGLYGVDFGWGKPVGVETSSIDATGAISFSNKRNGSGIEMGLVLSKDEMETFASLFEQGLKDILV